MDVKLKKFVCEEAWDYINLSVLSAGKVETFYTKEFMTTCGFCQGIVMDLVERVMGKDLDESEDYGYSMYKNVEFVRWRMDQRNKRLDVSSFLDSLNESRNDSINSSIFLQDNDISDVPRDMGSVWSQSNIAGNPKGTSVTGSNQSEVDSVFKMGTEKFMGSEKHYMGEENIKYEESNADGQSSTSSNAYLKGLFKKPGRVSRRKDGPVKMYTGKETAPVSKGDANLTEKNKPKKKGYKGAETYSGIKKREELVTENEINNRSRLHNYNNKEGEGVPLNSMDQKDISELNKTNQSDNNNNFSLFEIMKNKEEEKLNSLRRSGKLPEGFSNMKKKQELETITEEKTKSDAFTESKTIERDTTKGDQSKTKTLGPTSEVVSDTSMVYPYPGGVLEELHKEEILKNLGVSNNSLSGTNMSYQQVQQLTNKTIPPIMKNLFNSSMEDQQNNTQHLAYSTYPPQGYYPHPPPMVPVQIPQYQMPAYQMPMAPVQIPQMAPAHMPPMSAPPEPSTHEKTHESTSPSSKSPGEPERPEATQPNSSQMPQFNVQQYPMYQYIPPQMAYPAQPYGYQQYYPGQYQPQQYPLQHQYQPQQYQPQQYQPQQQYHPSYQYNPGNQHYPYNN
eukprot:CAMPEP_0196999998 /NCGR_PEP_ID=MMETSP1380-20130617/5056_1 /TAXON_ID=5936 /ORGANISM="Euplotes crassus, Strain CT5" /LENGTH=618 /DNA_ID=CAMNT_0042417137 /DNA_START=267 /DNA_END=2123 /DNA_ORIENTATION=+